MKINATDLLQNVERGRGAAARAKNSGIGEKDAGLWKAAKGFESMFMSQLLDAMQKTLPKGTTTEGGMAGMMFSQVMGDALTEGGGIGLAEMLYQELQTSLPTGSQKDGVGISLKKLVLPTIEELSDEE